MREKEPKQAEEQATFVTFHTLKNTKNPELTPVDLPKPRLAIEKPFFQAKQLLEAEPGFDAAQSEAYKTCRLALGERLLPRYDAEGRIFVYECLGRWVGLEKSDLLYIVESCF